jgi:hypothetical protein
MWALKTSAEIVVAAFTNHNAAIVRLKLRAPNIRWGRGRWSLNTTLLQDETLQRFHRQWESWKRLIPKYRNILVWWEYVQKGGFRDFSEQKEGNQREKDVTQNISTMPDYTIYREPYRAMFI